MMVLTRAFLQLSESQARPFREHVPTGSSDPGPRSHDPCCPVGFQRFDRVRLGHRHASGQAPSATQANPALPSANIESDRADRHSLCLSKHLAFSHRRGVKAQAESEIFAAAARPTATPSESSLTFWNDEKPSNWMSNATARLFDVSDLMAAYSPQPTGATAKDLECTMLEAALAESARE